MADVTGIPVPDGDDEFDVPGDLQAMADAIGAQSRYSVANTAALPSSGNWQGRTLHIEDIDVLVQWTGASWRRFYPVHAMAQGSAALPATGGGVSGGVGWSDLVDITFPAGRFSVPPIVHVTTVGPSDQVSLPGMAVDITTSGAKIRGGRAGSAPNNLFTAKWTAIQMLSGSATG